MPTLTEVNNRSAPGSFVGREREIERLSAGLETVLSGHGQLFLIEGEPGIGKSRLAHEVCAKAEARSVRAVWGRCWEGGGAPAYWPWIQIFRSLGDSSGLEPILQPNSSALVSDAAAEQSSIASELMFAGSAADRKRFMLFDALNQHLQRASEARPLLLVLDDCHAADPASMLFLKFVSRGLRKHRAMLLATYRATEVSTNPVLASLFAEIARDGERLHLEGISSDDVENLLKAGLGHRPESSLVKQLYHATDGNPFFLGELIRLISSEERGRRRGRRLVNLKVPEGVRATILKRLELVSPPTRKILLVASVLGREFDAALLGQVAGVDRSRIEAATEEGGRFAILDEQSHSIDRFRFHHALIPETLYGELPRGDRRRLHQKTAEAIEELFATNLEPHLSELAHHYSLAVTRENATRVAEYATHAAAAAQKTLAYEEAAHLYGMALRALETSLDPDQRRRCELMLSQGSTLYSSGNFDESRSVFKKAAVVATSQGDAHSHAVAVLGLGVAPSTPGVPDLSLISMLEDALRALDRNDSVIRVALMGRLAEELYWSEQRARRDELSSSAVQMARRLGDARALVDALYRRHIVLTGPDTIVERLELSAEILRLIGDIGPSDATLQARYLRIEDLLESGDVTSADSEIEAYRLSAQEVRQEHLGIIDLVLAMRALMNGRFEEAEQLALTGFEAARRRREGFSTQVLAVQMAVIRREQGRLDELVPIARSFTIQYPTLTLVRCGLAFLYAQLGDTASASFEFEYFWKNHFQTVERNATWLPSLVLLSEVCAVLRNREAAAELYRLLLPYAARIAMLDIYLCYGSVAHYLGMLAATLRDFEAAAAHFEAALEANVKMNARPLLAYTQYEYAKMLLARDEPGDRENAFMSGGRAMAAAESLGMKSLVERLRATIGQDSRAEADSEAAGAKTKVEPVSSTSSVASQREIASVLFTDVVGSTQRVAELKDRRWIELLQRFHQALRKQVADFGGREIDTAGDGMLSVFKDPTTAIRCAFAIIASAVQLGLDVRAGIHTGECEFVGNNIAGIAVHIGARVAAQAGAREVIVSNTVRDLLAGGEVIFNDRGVTALKGVPGEWHLYSVAAPIAR